MVQQRRARETREAIIDAAARLFADQSYALTSLGSIARAAGITQGAVYFHFGSKMELASEIIRREHAASIATSEAVLRIESSGLAGVVRLSAVLAQLIESRSVVRAGMRLQTESVNQMSAASRTPYEDWLAAASRFLAHAKARGELRSGIDAGMAAEVIVGAFTGTQYVATAVGASSELLHRLERMWIILLPALAAAPDAYSPAVIGELLKDPLGAGRSVDDIAVTTA